MNTRAKEQRAFTLIELLVVIGITALLAGLIVAAAGLATSKMRQSRVETERNALVLAIEAYKNKTGSYPPDNPASPTKNLLFYELTGTVFNENAATYNAIATADKFPVTTLRTQFNREGMLNSARDQSEVQNFVPAVGKGGRTGIIQDLTPYTVFGVPVPGPLETNTATGARIIPWSYVSTNPTNNQEHFDLWMDVYYSGRTNRISNWSPQPQPQ